MNSVYTILRQIKLWSLLGVEEFSWIIRKSLLWHEFFVLDTTEDDKIYTEVAQEIEDIKEGNEFETNSEDEGDADVSWKPPLPNSSFRCHQFYKSSLTNNNIISTCIYCFFNSDLVTSCRLPTLCEISFCSWHLHDPKNTCTRKKLNSWLKAKPLSSNFLAHLSPHFQKNSLAYEVSNYLLVLSQLTPSTSKWVHWLWQFIVIRFSIFDGLFPYKKDVHGHI